MSNGGGQSGGEPDRGGWQTGFSGRFKGKFLMSNLGLGISPVKKSKANLLSENSVGDDLS